MNAQDFWESWDQDLGSGSDPAQGRAKAKGSRRQSGQASVGARAAARGQG